MKTQGMNSETDRRPSCLRLHRLVPRLITEVRCIAGKYRYSGRKLRTETILHYLRSQLPMVAIALICGSSAAQDVVATGANSFAAVHLEPHAGQTLFEIGDPVLVDLVFSGHSPDYVVKTESSPYLQPVDQVDVAPDGGWVRTRGIARGLPLNLNALATLDGDAIRVPVLLNRTVTFLTPGHYEVTVTTERLRIAETVMKSMALDKCEMCRRTNAVGIDLVERDPQEEAATATALIRTIEDAKESSLESPLSAEQRTQMQHEIAEMQVGADLSDEDRARDQALLEKWNETVRRQTAAMEERRTARREAALRLACLDGDDAVRAKVRFIVTAGVSGDPDSVDWMMVDGLTSSRNKQLQLELIEQAWRDPRNVPNFQLQTALHHARELTRGQMVTDQPQAWARAREERQARLKADHGDIDAVVATLPRRSEENRAATVDYLKRVGANQVSGLNASR